jgi:hypothetical protein
LDGVVDRIVGIFYIVLYARPDWATIAAWTGWLEEGIRGRVPDCQHKDPTATAAMIYP